MNNRYLITSALPYIDGVKHLGNLVGSLLPADVYARFLRQNGHKVLYICATDEHGTPAELGALKSNLPPSDFCDLQYTKQSEIYARFRLSFDYFGRTSSQQNKELTQHFAKKLLEQGFIEPRKIKQLYSKTDKRFLPDRYVIGICPKCGYEHARGDQCENCTKLLDPTDLIRPRSAISGSTDLEIKGTNHLFLLLSKMSNKIGTWVDSKNKWPSLVKSIAYKWLNEGLQDRCITRDLKWGVPVGLPGFESKVFYVWFDAPIGYIAATKELSDLDPEKMDWRSWWLSAEDVIYTQFLAKDNIPFHAISFPATLIGSGEPWKTVDNIKGFNWLNYYGGKFSTSQHRGIFTSDALEILPSDYWRYYLLSRAPESSDADFTWEDFQSVINKDLANVLGNFINRTLRFCENKFGACIPESSEWTEQEYRFAEQIRKIINSFSSNLYSNQFRKAIQELRLLWSTGNSYIADAAPWTVVRENPDRAKTIISLAINFIRIIAVVSNPIIPDTCENLFDCLQTDFGKDKWVSEDMEKELKTLKPRHEFKTIEVLFKKIENVQINILKKRFGAEAIN
jgi:methionyl-tRNA synthetase